MNTAVNLAWLAPASIAVTLAACAERVPPAPARLASTTALATAPPESAKAGGPKEDPLAAETRGWELGRRYDYRVAMTSAVAFGDRPATDFDLVGDLRVVPVRTSANEATLFLAIERGKFASRLPGTQADLDARGAKLGSPYFAKLSGGRVVEIALADKVDGVVANVYRTVSAALQFARPMIEAPSWTAFEYDSTGRYTATYRHGDGDSRFFKQKNRYLGVLGTEATARGAAFDLSPDVVSSTAAIELSPAGRPLHVVAADQIAMNNAQSAVHATTKLELTAVRESSEPDLQRLLALLSTQRRLGVNDAVVGEGEGRSLDEQRIGGLSLDAILQRVEQGAATGRDAKANEAVDNDEARLFTALAATLRNHPEAVDRVRKRIEAKSKASQLLVDALASAGTDVSQRALIALVTSEPTGSPWKNSILISLSRTPRPSEESVQTLMTIARSEDAPPQALYGLGTFARLLKEEGKTDRSERVGQFLVQRLAGARDHTAVSHGLKALANSGYTPALDVVKAFVADHHEQVRIDALTALRSMESPEVDALVAERLTVDVAAGARIRALDVAERRAPSAAIAAVLPRAARDPSPHVRYRAAKLIARWLPEHQELRPVLEAIAKDDGEKNIREVAEAALSPQSRLGSQDQ